MNLKKYLEKLIRGWLPKEPILPHPQKREAVSEQAKVPTKPDVTMMLDRRFQLNSGITIGLGVGLILAGFIGWLSVNYTYETLKNFFSAGGLDPNYYLFKNLIDQIAIYLTLMSTGAVTLLWGGLIVKSPAARRLFASKGPHYQLGGGLTGGGGALAFISMYHLFVYVLTSDYLELQLFYIFFIVGVFLFACGILRLRQGGNGETSTEPFALKR
jgi:hypothetical protein